MKRAAQLLFLMLVIVTAAEAQNKTEPWTEKELKSTKELADEISQGKAVPVIINIGPQAVIKGSLDAGPANEKGNVRKLGKILAGQDKTKEVVLYCGCCPFEKCPNIRPAFTLLKQQGFTRPRLLDIPKNIKTDWIDKGYPVTE